MDILSNINKKKIFFIGIGGIGMSALAMMLSDNGFVVCGSDISQNKNIKKLQHNDIKCFIGHNALNIGDDIGLVVFTSIIAENNPELIEAKKRDIEIVSRANLLNYFLQKKKSITIAGTHGKTTITTMVSNLLDGFDLNVNVVNGGIINSYNSNYKIDDGNLIIAESDESDGSFANLKTDIGLISNIEPEHMEFYNNDFTKVRQYYENYIKSTKEVVIICLDDPELLNIYNKLKNKVNFITYGKSKNADFSLRKFLQNKDGICFSFYSRQDKKEFEDISLRSYGLHNAINALCSIAAARYLSCDLSKLNKSFAFYQGVQRRFTKIPNGNDFTIIDDYAHHPTEIIATIETAKKLTEDGSKLIVVFQAHKISRLENLFTEFISSFLESDLLIVLDVYEPDPYKKNKITRKSIANEIRKVNSKSTIIDLSNEDLEGYLRNNSDKDDVVLFVGAGDISSMARGLGKVNQDSIDYRQALHRSLQRGCKETDILLGKFAEVELKNFSNNKLALYSQFIQEDDVYIYDWILAKTEIKEKYKDLIFLIREFHDL